MEACQWLGMETSVLFLWKTRSGPKAWAPLAWLVRADIGLGDMLALWRQLCVNSLDATRPILTPGMLDYVPFNLDDLFIFSVAFILLALLGHTETFLNVGKFSLRLCRERTLCQRFIFPLFCLQKFLPDIEARAYPSCEIVGQVLATVHWTMIFFNWISFLLGTFPLCCQSWELRGRFIYLVFAKWTLLSPAKSFIKYLIIYIWP